MPTAAHGSRPRRPISFGSAICSQKEDITLTLTIAASSRSAALCQATRVLFVYQEDFGTLGNNVIGAAPQHPVIGRALDLAVAAVGRGDRDILWLSTGPGLLTRAFAQTLASTPLVWAAWLDQIVVLDRRKLRHAVAHTAW